ncbi:hypothetical protein niasHT_001207 [Heterodera trifolii]|uniref:EF-hand domain-containing protein n=1 Tax=Heterodera trifolii TaxID=157864 RepID=A0ABD2MC76_9BILA
MKFVFRCVVSLEPACNIFGHNCVVCEFHVSRNIFTECEISETRCSCYYCCDSNYATYCPQGCKDCIKDGEDGCPENSKANARIASSNLTENSSFVNSLKKVETARKHFDTVDADKSGAISMKEAIEYLVETKNGTSADHLAKNNEWFGKMDRNGNSQIEPVEFDRSLV